jgi:multidrug resistance efflux pump
MTPPQTNHFTWKAAAILAVRVLLTMALICVAVVAGYNIWTYYERAPRTRDAHVRADVVGVTSDVAGLITEVDVHSNQPVKRGDVLFRIDPQRYEIAERKARSSLEGMQAQLIFARQQDRRNRSLEGIVAQQQTQQTDSNVRTAQANVEQAQAALASAELDLERSTVRASVNGIATNVTLRPGSYIAAGTGMIALVDTDSLRVEGYFQETRLEHVHVGDTVDVQLIGDARWLHGHVTSISGAINDSDSVVGSNLLPSISPNFSWVRLAQRVPVWIHIDTLPPGLLLLPGRTATVSVNEGSHP